VPLVQPTDMTQAASMGGGLDTIFVKNHIDIYTRDTPGVSGYRYDISTGYTMG